MMGHSNGGDMSVLYTRRHPKNVSKLITLDNRRFPLLKFKKLKTCTLRSCDQIADVGVIPCLKEQKKCHIEVIKLKNTFHNDMCNSATEEQRIEILKYITDFLKK